MTLVKLLISCIAKLGIELSVQRACFYIFAKRHVKLCPRSTNEKFHPLAVTWKHFMPQKDIRQLISYALSKTFFFEF